MITSIVVAALLGQQKSIIDKPAPEFIGSEWLNAAKPLTMAARKGKVTVIHFWTFACINCKHNLPAIQHIYDKFKNRDVEVISVHTPELAEEKDVDNVKKAVEKYGIKYPVLIDGKYENWKAWKTEYWPTVYIIDKENKVRAGWAGELNFNNQRGEEKMIAYIEQLLKG